MSYKFKYRRRWLWKSELVKAHQYDKEQDKMVLFYPDDSVREIKEWKNCEVSLGLDWLEASKKAREKQESK